MIAWEELQLKRKAGSAVGALRRKIMRRAGARLVSIVACGSVVASCSGSPPVESILIANFNRPASSQVARSEKSDFSAPGFPVDVEVEGKDTAGRIIELQDAKLEVRLPGADWTLGPNAVLNGAKAVFPGTALATGTTGLRVTITEKPSMRRAINTMDAVVPVGTGCAVAITSPPTNPFAFNISTNEGPGPQLQYTMRGTSDACAGVPITLLKGASTPTAIASGTVNATGAFSIPFVLADGEQTRLVAQMTDPFPPNPVTSAFVDVTVKVSPPLFTNVSPPDSTLFYVADSNINLGRPGYIQNLGPSDTALLANFSLTIGKAIGGTARLVYNGTDLAAAVPITSDPQNVAWRNASLPPKSMGTIQLRATDGAGNETIRSASVTIDVIPPAPSSFADAGLAPGGARTATVDVQWTSTGDDGFAGAPAGYDLRWSTSTVVRPDAGYFDPNMFTQTQAGILPPSQLSKRLTPLPPLNTYLFQVRGFDAIGNYSRQSPQASVNNFWTQTSVLNPESGTGFGLHLEVGDFNGDGLSDLAINASTTNPGAVYVYLGRPDLSTFGAAPTWILRPRDSQNGFFGLDFSAGKVNDDPAPTRRSDLLVSQNVWDCNGTQLSRGRAFLYIRALNNDPSCSAVNPCIFEFRGPPPGPNSFGATSRIIPDINGDGLDEIVISSHRENSTQGRVYLFYGRTQAQWRTLTTAEDGACPTLAGAGYIPTSAADKFFDGDSPPAPPPFGNFFGRLHGYTTVDNRALGANVLFTVPSSLESIHKLFVHSAPVVQGWTGGMPIPTSAAIQNLNYGPDSTPVSSFGFGAEAIGFVNFIRGPAKDLLVTQPRFDKLYLFADGTSAGFTSGSPLIVSGATPGRNLGASLAQGDINADGKPDIVVGENFSPTPSDRLTPWILYNTGPVNQEFDLTVGAGFSQSRLLSTATPSNLGIGVAVGDFNGDGRADVAAGDNVDGLGRVTVWY